MATTTTKKQQIEELTAKVKELTEKIDDLNITNGDLVKENEELQIENELLKAEVEELKTKKNTTKKEPETFTGTMKEYREWGKDIITKKELLEWIDNPDEVKTITAKQNKSKVETSLNRKQKEGNICYARVYNEGKGGRCNNTAKDNKWCYCSQHNNQYIEGKLKNGDVRITGKGSIPNHKAFEKKLGYTFDMVCEEIDGEEWLVGFN